MTTELPVKQPYQPLGSLEKEKREEIVRGALQLLAQDATLHDVAKILGTSKTTLIGALNAYAEYEWKALQVARAQAAVHRAAESREAIALRLEGYQEKEDSGEKSTETALTHSRMREQLRIAEHEEKSAQWHLERLHRRVYGNSLKIEADQDIDNDLWTSVEHIKKSDAFYAKHRAPEVDAATGKPLTAEERSQRARAHLRVIGGWKRGDDNHDHLVETAARLLHSIADGTHRRALYIAVDEAGNRKDLYERPTYWTWTEPQVQAPSSPNEPLPDAA